MGLNLSYQLLTHQLLFYQLLLLEKILQLVSSQLEIKNVTILSSYLLFKIFYQFDLGNRIFKKPVLAKDKYVS